MCCSWEIYLNKQELPRQNMLARLFQTLWDSKIPLAGWLIFLVTIFLFNLPMDVNTQVCKPVKFLDLVILYRMDVNIQCLKNHLLYSVTVFQSTASSFGMELQEMLKYLSLRILFTIHCFASFCNVSLLFPLWKVSIFLVCPQRGTPPSPPLSNLLATNLYLFPWIIPDSFSEF